MKYFCSVTIIFLLIHSGFSQVPLTPSVFPSLFKADDLITVTYDVTGTPLANLTSAYLWLWIPNKTIDAKYNINPASSNSALTDNVKFTKEIADGRTLFKITLVPSEFFNVAIEAETSLGMLLKGNDWSNGQTTDFVSTFWDGSFQINLITPVEKPLFVEQGQTLTIKAESPVPAIYKLYVNDDLKFESGSITEFTYDYEVAQSSGRSVVTLTASSEDNSAEVEFSFLISAPSQEVVRPLGIIPGINYSADHTTATVCLLAPEKTSVYVRGDFTDWQISPEYLMKKDGEYFWLEITGLTPGTEYAFQYLVDETIFMADPYADKILDPDDQYISPQVYPGLKPYPSAAQSDKWYFNRVSVLQTNQQEYIWQVEDFEKPEKENLIIYELLIRDFFSAEERNYQNLIDTISYFKRLGVNAIELMPIMEFNGNDSWGYNPTFMFAPDKYYGPKNKLKEFIDKCHQEGIAVILDIAMNHQDIPNPYVLIDYDFTTGKPKITNKWFNPDAKHPFNVFFDMNHESAYTKAYLDTVNHYWLNEYKVDGFRFDLSKGFTQKNNPDNVDAWGKYDDSRIAILKRMADKIWLHTPTAFIILEHLSENPEEKELAEYRSDEGKGMMFWGNMNHAFNQLTMGYADESDISGVNYSNRSWSVPHLVTYMESHDEERLMYRNMEYGSVEGSYSTKNPATSIQRIKAASLLFYAVPGPKMLWQFGEYAYDFSINTCHDGSIDLDCRVSVKPVVWNYLEESGPLSLFNVTSDLIRLHTTYSVFTSGTASISSGNSLIKQVQLKNKSYSDKPTTPEEMNVQAISNFLLTGQSVAVDFPHTGIWYDYYSGGNPVNVTSLPFTLFLEAGGYKLYTDVFIGEGPVTTRESETNYSDFNAFPNPTNGKFQISELGISKYGLVDVHGTSHFLERQDGFFDISKLPAGLYIIWFQHWDDRITTKRIIKY